MNPEDEELYNQFFDSSNWNQNISNDDNISNNYQPFDGGGWSRGVDGGNYQQNTPAAYTGPFLGGNTLNTQSIYTPSSAVMGDMSGAGNVPSTFSPLPVPELSSANNTLFTTNNNAPLTIPEPGNIGDTSTVSANAPTDEGSSATEMEKRLKKLVTDASARDTRPWAVRDSESSQRYLDMQRMSELEKARSMQDLTSRGQQLSAANALEAAEKSANAQLGGRAVQGKAIEQLARERRMDAESAEERRTLREHNANINAILASSGRGGSSSGGSGSSRGLSSQGTKEGNMMSERPSQEYYKQMEQLLKDMPAVTSTAATVPTQKEITMADVRKNAPMGNVNTARRLLTSAIGGSSRAPLSVRDYAREKQLGLAANTMNDAFSGSMDTGRKIAASNASTNYANAINQFNENERAGQAELARQEALRRQQFALRSANIESNYPSYW